MKRRTWWWSGMLALAMGCQFFPAGKTPPSVATTKPTATPPVTLPTTPSIPVTVTPDPVPTPMLPPAGNLNILSDGQLGYLVANNTAGLVQGTVSGPVSLVAHHSAGLISNNAAGIVSNNSGGYRTATVNIVSVADGFVYLTAPDERFYVTRERRLFSTLTDDKGAFRLVAPATDSLIVNVLLSGNRRLTAISDTSSAEPLAVDLASTMVTEFLRAKASEHSFTLSQVLANPVTKASLSAIQRMTRELVQNDQVLARIKSTDLLLNNIPFLRQRYVIAFGTAPDHALSDEWVKLLRTIKNDFAALDSKYRSLALTTLDAGIAPGSVVLGVTVDNNGNSYLTTM
ncbi:MAG: hypothetical protein HY692_05920, partial [Cyanobacteria bacterium NC_groundwater_1444_Ag_S-0.65um_54_12]|nr:hypothetical protein [Cyanobacteria bacterium NC_groundwater_1444_Ag_S-0.65um_54_12]